MSVPTQTKQYLLAAHPKAQVDVSENFKLTTTPIPSLKEDQVLLKVRYLSNDPAQRGWISYHPNPERLYVPPVKLGEVMRAGGISTVVKSTSSKFKEGDSVVATVGWTEYAVVDAAECTPLRSVPGLDETHFLGALGLTGMTAFWGLEVVGTSSKDELLVVSGAAGATGSMVVQIAKKLIGVKKVVGMAGTDEKCRWVESIGADVCINYKAKDFRKQLKEATQGNVDVYFDNVGAPILDAVMARMKTHGRIAACGAVATYNSGEGADPVRNWFEVISSRLVIKGFIVFDGAHRFGDYIKQLSEGFQSGKIQIDDKNETVVPTNFEDIPQTWLKLFVGANQGKLVTKLQ
ncbi:2-alkenal reductase (NADP(+)-dependent) [Sphaceloma murrayae]|uniref:2-alkenal reductase (NADP(+)-dependent) n=1 Tax=Sphaceloma murrayae TaxID=2082308 RepID=A0A2K1QK08_9PEZI|nr:2-alkenal reductase (NADP(+)-dependent) [Sphaceloma murrayae]